MPDNATLQIGAKRRSSHRLFAANTVLRGVNCSFCQFSGDFDTMRPAAVFRFFSFFFPRSVGKRWRSAGHQRLKGAKRKQKEENRREEKASVPRTRRNRFPPRSSFFLASECPRPPPRHKRRRGTRGRSEHTHKSTLE